MLLAACCTQLFLVAHRRWFWLVIVLGWNCLDISRIWSASAIGVSIHLRKGSRFLTTLLSVLCPDGRRENRVPCPLWLLSMAWKKVQFSSSRCVTCINIFQRDQGLLWLLNIMSNSLSRWAMSWVNTTTSSWQNKACHFSNRSSWLKLVAFSVIVSGPRRRHWLRGYWVALLLRLDSP